MDDLDVAVPFPLLDQSLSVDFTRHDETDIRSSVIALPPPSSTRSLRTVAPRIPLPDKPKGEPTSVAEYEQRSVLFLLRKLSPIPTPEKNGFVQSTCDSDEIAAFDKLLELLPPNRYSQDDLLKLVRAYLVASHAHSDQRRKSGESYILHPIATAQILAELGMDPDTLAAAILHDVIEDTEEFTNAYLTEHFGAGVASLVEGVTKLKRINELSAPHVASDQGASHNPKAESLRKMFLAMAEDIRVVLIKLADRLHNMRTLHGQKEHSRRRIARETLDIFAPLANRLGIWPIKSELEDLSFRYLEPATYKELTKQVLQKQPEHEKQLARIKVELERALAAGNIPAQVSGRFKHVYSIYKKMKRKDVPFEQIYDMLAFRIMVETDAQCYQALGVVHGLWRPIPGEFDDYIASPKDNNYRSLHTGVYGSRGRPMEVQIRTRQMHEEAEFGIAAHWRYKEQARFDAKLQEKISWLRQLIDWRKDVSDADQFVNTVTNDLFRESVFVVTPKGDIIDLTASSTPIDFAYAIHTELGHRCRGATINGRMVPLDYKLQNGDQVAIVAAKRGGPSRDWLNPTLEYVATNRARNKIRQWLRKQARDENILRGREALEKELRRLSITKSFDSISTLFGYDDVDDFLATIGWGEINTQQIAQRLLDQEKQNQPTQFSSGLTISVIGSDENGLQVAGMSGMLTVLGRCCRPAPGDQIIGYITRGRGVTVHSVKCPNVANFMRSGNEKRIIDVQWATSTENVYQVKIQISAFDRPGLVRDISSLVADERVNMSDVTAETGKKHNMAVVHATLQIKDTGQLMRILTRIEKIPNVVEAWRLAL